MSNVSSTSTSTVVTSIVFNLILFSGFVLGFLLLRLRFKRIYQPKSSFNLVPPEKRPEPLPLGVYKWVWILLSKPHSFIIQQSGIDGYFFLRYLLIVTCITGFGLLLYPVLITINVVHGKNNAGFDKLSISNVKYKHRYYAHAFSSWVFFSFVLFVIYRELFFYASLRQAILTSPKYAGKLSSRTVLFQTVPKQYLHRGEFFKLFNGVKKVWVTRGVRELRKKVAERELLSTNLEYLENKLLKKAMKEKIKMDKKGIRVEVEDDIDSYVPRNKRPTIRLKPIIGKKVDAIDHIKERLPKLNKMIIHLQKTYKKTKPMNSIFVEFHTQYDAEVACQSVAHHLPFHMGPSFIGIDPSNIIWFNMRLFWYEKIIRRSMAVAGIIALVLFWAVPTTFIGIITNITYLTNKVHFLRFILRLPHALYGVVTSLLPSILLSFLGMLLPMFIRGLARVSGCVTAQQIEYFTQGAYFSFQVINTFLVTAITSSATSTVTQIVNKPSSAMSILATDLPKSSNFFISYIILQGIGIAGGALFQIVQFITFYILAFLLDKTVRSKYNRFHGLSTYAWGTTFPIYTNLAVISIAYAIVSPLILVFAFASFAILYLAYLHNLTYVFDEAADGRGMYYPRALFQTITGVYIGEICLLGIFVVGKGWGPVILEAIMIGVTIFVHVQFNEAFDNLLNVVPVDCMKPLDGFSNTPSYSTTDAPIYDAEMNEQFRDEKLQTSTENSTEASVPDLVPLLADGHVTEETSTSNFLYRFIRPDIYNSYRYAKKMLPSSYKVDPEVDESANDHAYDFPVVSATPPVIWIPKDPMGLSKKEIESFKGIAPMTDEHTEFTEKGDITWLDAPPSIDDIGFQLHMSGVTYDPKDTQNMDKLKDRIEKYKAKRAAKRNNNSKNEGG